jgi:hypothetical protein
VTEELPRPNLPRIYTSRQVFGFDLVQSLATKQVGEAMLREAYKQRATVLAEVGRQLPEHVIDPRAVLLEIGIQYLATPEGD